MPPPTSRGGGTYFTFTSAVRDISGGWVCFLVVVVSESTPKSRRTAEAVCVTKFRNRMRKSATFCRKCGRKIPQERRRNGWGLSAVPASPRLQVCRSRPRVRFARQAALPRCVQTSKRTLRSFCLQRSVRGAGAPCLAPCRIFLFTYSLDYFAAI